MFRVLIDKKLTGVVYSSKEIFPVACLSGVFKKSISPGDSCCCGSKDPPISDTVTMSGGNPKELKTASTLFCVPFVLKI